MTRIVFAVCVLLLIQGITLADDKPQAYSGTMGPANAVFADVAAAMGHNGVLFIRSQGRWDELKKLMPELTSDAPLPKFDFAKQSAVLVYADERHADDAFSLGECDLTADPPQLNFHLTWDNSPEEQRRPRCTKFILAVIPAAPAVKVALTSSPTNVDRSRIVTEFSAVLGGKDGGDVVDGLQAVITPKIAAIKPGEDIQVDFILRLADRGDAKPEQFGSSPKSVFVWDGKYSNGYRNHAFLVSTPDGKTTLLRPKEIDEWDKNAPHPVGITAAEPYHLPNWAEGETHKSLKELGLDTSKPGIYSITGIYEEAGSQPRDVNDKKPLWGGSIASNTITVEVK